MTWSPVSGSAAVKALHGGGRRRYGAGIAGRSDR